jgi:hypothetical protein
VQTVTNYVNRVRFEVITTRLHEVHLTLLGDHVIYSLVLDNLSWGFIALDRALERSVLILRLSIIAHCFVIFLCIVILEDFFPAFLCNNP